MANSCAAVRAVLVAVAVAAAAQAWGQQKCPVQLLQPEGAANDSFGSSVAVSGDTMIVGAHGDDSGPNANQGSAWVYRRSGSTWFLEAVLTASDGAAGDQFGYSVAVSGDTAVVGAWLDTVGANQGQGSAYVFVRSGTVWTQQAKLTASDGIQVAFFGSAVAVTGDTAAIGAHNDQSGGGQYGSAYVFVRSGTVWTQQAKLTASDAQALDMLGNSIAVSGDTVVVGAASDDTGGTLDHGSAYVFVRSGTVWTQQAKLLAPVVEYGEQVGISVSISGNTVVLGARGDNVGANSDQGSAYVFTRSGTVWTQQAKLTASDGAMNDGLGSSVSLGGDTAVVGALGDDVGANGNQGSAYVFTRSGTVWTQQAKLTASDGAGDDAFGRSVAVSGDTAVVGAWADDVGANADQGSAYVFTRAGTVWTQQAQITAADGSADDQFGISVAVSGDTAVVGAYLEDVGAITDQGSAYVFTRSGTVWTQQARLTASDGTAGDWFGISVAVSGDTAVLGAFQDTLGTNTNQGSAYVFVRTAGVWVQQAKLTASDGAAFDLFGYSVAVAGDTAVVGALFDDVGTNAEQGSAYVFTRPPAGTVWTQQTKLTASDGAAGDWFGFSVSVSGDTAVVGAFRDTVGLNAGQGSAYIFTRSGTVWTEQAKLTASDGGGGDEFGVSAAVAGDTAVVGAQRDDVGANADQGSAYVFTRSGTIWTQQAKLTASDGAAVDQFGYAAAVSGDTAVVGAFRDTVGLNAGQGSAYVFTRPPAGTVWIQQAKLSASDGAADDRFGTSVAISGDTAVVGAVGDNVGAILDQGSAWVFRHVGATWTGPDFNNSGTVTVQDLFDYLAAFFSSSPSADFNGTGTVTIQDLFDFLAAFFAGCA